MSDEAPSPCLGAVLSGAPDAEESLLGGIELGGTHVVCAMGTGPDALQSVEFPTTRPEETIHRCARFFREQHHAGRLAALGVASFGPLCPDPCASDYGRITTTPKPGWAHTDVLGGLRRSLGGDHPPPLTFDTDVNGAALAEGRWGAARGLHTFLYVTVGTGIGGGAMVHGQLLHGLLHPELGHVRVPREGDDYPGNCPVHGDCLEGLVSGPALEQRWGHPAHELPDDHPAWPLTARTLALGLVNWVLTLAPQRVVMGGGVSRRKQLLPLLRAEFRDLLGGYLDVPELSGSLEEFLVEPELGDLAGVLGAMSMAEEALTRTSTPRTAPPS